MIFDGNQDKETIIINESGLYSLILSSKMPNAKKFKHWVTAEVLPTIRKHGMYAIDEILENPDLAIAALTQLKEERERRKQLECLALVQRQQIAEMQPKASYYDLILQNKNTVPITQIAKDYGMSGRKFNELLHELGVQYKFRKTWLLYQQYAECGYTQSRTYAIDESRSVMHTYWTQKGRLFLYDLLKNEGILPVIEQEDQKIWVLISLITKGTLTRPHTRLLPTSTVRKWQLIKRLPIFLWCMCAVRMQVMLKPM